MSSLSTQLGGHLPDFSTISLLFFFLFLPPFHITVLLPILWKQVTKFSPYPSSRNEELRSWASLSWREKYSYKLFRILSRRFLSSSLFSHFIISVWTHGYLFDTMNYNLVLFHLFCCWSNCPNFDHWELFQVDFWVTCRHHLVFEHFFTFWYNNISQDHFIYYLPQT